MCSSCSADGEFPLYGGCAIHLPRELIKTDGHSLSQVHRDILRMRADGHQPVAVAEVIVGQPDLLGAKQQCYPALLQDRVDDACRMPIQRLGGRSSFRSRMAVVPTTSAQSATASATESNSSAFLSTSRSRRRQSRRLAEGEAKGIHHPQMARSEIAHRARRRPDVQRVAWTPMTTTSLVKSSSGKRSFYDRPATLPYGGRGLGELFTFGVGLLGGFAGLKRDIRAPSPPRSFSERHWAECLRQRSTQNHPKFPASPRRPQGSRTAA